MAKARIVKQADSKPAKPVNRGGNPNWKPGVSGNPNGRPKIGAALSDLLRAKMDELHPVAGVPWRDLVVQTIMEKAISGDMRAAELVMERIDGKVSQTLNLGGKIDWSGMTPEERSARISELLARRGDAK